MHYAPQHILKVYEGAASDTSVIPHSTAIEMHREEISDMFMLLHEKKCQLHLATEMLYK